MPPPVRFSSCDVIIDSTKKNPCNTRHHQVAANLPLHLAATAAGLAPFPHASLIAIIPTWLFPHASSMAMALDCNHSHMALPPLQSHAPAHKHIHTHAHAFAYTLNLDTHSSIETERHGQKDRQTDRQTNRQTDLDVLCSCFQSLESIDTLGAEVFVRVTDCRHSIDCRSRQTHVLQPDLARQP